MLRRPGAGDGVRQLGGAGPCLTPTVDHGRHGPRWTWTTVDMDLADLGRQAGRTLLALIEGNTEVPRRQVLTPRLEVRGSTL